MIAFTDPPGSRFRYRNAKYRLLPTILTHETGTNAATFARREPFEPLEIRDVFWPADPAGNSSVENSCLEGVERSCNS